MSTIRTQFFFYQGMRILVPLPVDQVKFQEATAAAAERAGIDPAGFTSHRCADDRFARFIDHGGCVSYIARIPK